MKYIYDAFISTVFMLQVRHNFSSSSAFAVISYSEYSVNASVASCTLNAWPLHSEGSSSRPLKRGLEDLEPQLWLDALKSNSTYGSYF